MTDPIRNVLDRLERVRKNGSGYTARCPAHDDGNPSLSVGRASDGKVLLHCHAGCSYADIMTALRLEPSDGFPDEADASDWNPWKDGEQVAVYPYTDAEGEPLYEVVRFEVKAGHPAYPDKTFIQRTPDGSWGRDGIQPVLYRLPSVREAASAGRVVFVVEGEKDVHTLAEADLAATCNLQGAGEWKGRYADDLAGAVVVILPDNDEPGREHAETVAASCYGKAASVRIVELPDLPRKGDVTDWMNAGHTAADLKREANDAPAWEPPAREEPASEATDEPSQIGVLASDVERERVRWLWKGRLALGELTILDGDPGLGKSTLLCDVAARMTAGRAMPGEQHPSEPGGVVYVTGEDSIAHTIRPRLEAAGADLGRCLIVPHLPDEKGIPCPAVIPDDLGRLARGVKRVGAGLVAIDPLMAHLPGTLNAHRDQDVRAALTPLKRFAEELNVAVVVIRHLNKSPGLGSLYRGGGSIGIIGAFRIGLLMGRDPDDEDRLALAPNKNNLAVKPSSLALRLEASENPALDVARIQWEGPCDLTPGDLLQRPDRRGRSSEAEEEAEAFLREILADGEPRRSREVYELMEERGISKKTLRRAKSSLGIESERPEPNGGPWYFVPPWDAREEEPHGQNSHMANPKGDNSGHVAQNAANADFGGNSGGPEGHMARNNGTGHVGVNGSTEHGPEENNGSSDFDTVAHDAAERQKILDRMNED